MPDPLEPSAFPLWAGGRDHRAQQSYAGASIAEGAVFWGSGYTHLGPSLPFTGNNQLFSFTVNGK